MVLEPDHAGLIRALRQRTAVHPSDAWIAEDAADAIQSLLADAKRNRWRRANARGDDHPLESEKAHDARRD